jgi:NTE family protein
MYDKRLPDYRRLVARRRPSNRRLLAAPMAAFPDSLDLAGIKNLAMEGGGGKGCAYLGAIIALEELGKLPTKAGDSSRIDSISGASAGAITAFLLALGLSSAEIWDMTRAQPSKFLEFFDMPANGRARVATFQDDAGPMARAKQNNGARIKPINIKVNLTDPPGFFDVTKVLLALAPLLRKGGRQPHSAGPVERFIFQFLKGKTVKSKSNWDDNLLAAIKRDPRGYLNNLFSDPGVFPGFAVRQFLARRLADRMSSPGFDADSRPDDHPVLVSARKMTFEDFLDLTKVDLVIAGTNLTTGKPAYFSALTTPKFPVIEAVGLSMSIPISFKSVYLDTDKESYDDFRGWWGDGGVINNFPLHAFNKDRNGVQPALPHERAALPFNPATLGLTLDEPDLTPFGVPKVPKPDFPSALGMIGPLMDALMFSSTEGQIRNAVERKHALRLNAYFLDTFDLAPEPVVVAATVPDARKKIYEAFAPQQIPKSLKDMSETYKSVLKVIVDDVQDRDKHKPKEDRKKLEQFTTEEFVEWIMRDITADARTLGLLRTWK